MSGLGIIDIVAEPGLDQAGWMYGEGIVHHTAFQVDGHGELQPAIDTFRGTTTEVGTPAFTSSFIEDVYLALTEDAE